MHNSQFLCTCLLVKQNSQSGSSNVSDWRSSLHISDFPKKNKKPRRGKLCLLKVLIRFVAVGLNLLSKVSIILTLWCWRSVHSNVRHVCINDWMNPGVEAMKVRTRQYAMRQLRWIRNRFLRRVHLHSHRAPSAHTADTPPAHHYLRLPYSPFAYSPQLLP